MHAGNEAFRSGRLADAEQHYQAGLNRFTERDLLREENGNLICLIANHHNLAELYKRCSDSDAVLHHLLEPHRLVLRQLSEAGGESQGVLRACRAMRYTLPPLMSFAKTAELCDECRLMLQRSAEWLGEHQYH